MGAHEVRWFFHATAVVEDYLATRDALIDLVGLRVLEDTVIEDERINRRGGMTWIGDNSLEIGQPLRPGPGMAATLARMRPCLQLVAVQVQDLDATCEHLRGVGATVMRTHDHIALTHPRDCGGVFFEWFTGQPEFDPRFGGPVPDYHRPAALDVQRMSWVGAMVHEPAEMARRAAQMLGTEVTFADVDAPPGAPAAGVSLADNTLALFPMVDEDECRRLWGVAHPRPRSHALAVEVPDLEAAAEALARRRIGVVRRDDVGIVLDPKVTGMAPVVITGRLLPGDPRL